MCGSPGQNIASAVLPMQIPSIFGADRAGSLLGRRPKPIDQEEGLETLKTVSGEEDLARRNRMRSMASRFGMGSTNVTGGVAGDAPVTNKALLGQ